jgi:hypothetical protein
MKSAIRRNMMLCLMIEQDSIAFQASNSHLSGFKEQKEAARKKFFIIVHKTAGFSPTHGKREARYLFTHAQVLPSSFRSSLPIFSKD